MSGTDRYLRASRAARENGPPRKDGAWRPDQERVHHDAHCDPQRILRTRPRRREREDDVVHDPVEQHAIEWTEQQRSFPQLRPASREEVVRHRHRRRDEVVEREAEECGRPAAGEARVAQQAGGDRLENACRKDATFQPPEGARVRDVERAGDKATEENIERGSFHGLHGNTVWVRLLSAANSKPRITSSDHSGVTASSAVPSITSRTFS